MLSNCLRRTPLQRLLTLKSLWVSSLPCLLTRMISTSAGRRGRIVAGSCTGMQCPFEWIPPCFNICTCTVGASLAISICLASNKQLNRQLHYYKSLRPSLQILPHLPLFIKKLYGASLFYCYISHVPVFITVASGTGFTFPMTFTPAAQTNLDSRLGDDILHTKKTQ